MVYFLNILIPLVFGLSFGAWVTGDFPNLWRRWRQHRLVAKLRREHWKRFDAAALVKAKILAVGAVYEFTDTFGTPSGVFALCGCWHFDPGNGALGYTQDSKGVIRMFGYTKAEVIYIAEHAKEFVDA